jgi:hypothetical protein
MTISPQELVENLPNFFKTFKLGVQQDAHEFLRSMLSSLEEIANLQFENSLNTNSITEIFGGTMQSQIECSKCNIKSQKNELFLDVSLPIKKNDSVWRILKAYTTRERVIADKKCDTCQSVGTSSKRLTVLKPPSVLVIHLKRFKYNRSGVEGAEKICDFVPFELELDLTQFLSNSSSKSPTYNLCGVLVHRGDSSNEGHYISFVKHSNGSWGCADDSKISSVTVMTVKAQQAYILFYTSDQSTTSPGPTHISAPFFEKSHGQPQNVIPNQAESPTSVPQASTQETEGPSRNHSSNDEQQNTIPASAPTPVAHTPSQLDQSFSASSSTRTFLSRLTFLTLSLHDYASQESLSQSQAFNEMEAILDLLETLNDKVPGFDIQDILDSKDLQNVIGIWLTNSDCTILKMTLQKIWKEIEKLQVMITPQSTLVTCDEFHDLLRIIGSRFIFERYRKFPISEADYRNAHERIRKRKPAPSNLLHNHFIITFIITLLSLYYHFIITLLSLYYHFIITLLSLYYQLSLYNHFIITL